MTNLQKLLAEARAELIKASDWLHRVRRSEVLENHPAFLDSAIAARHRASDRVWELQCMVEGSLR